MAKRGELIGHIGCPLCDFPEMEVRPDKNGRAYAWCPDCTAQILTHGGERERLLRAKMRPVTVTGTTPQEPAAPKPASVTVTDTPKPAPPAKPAAKPGGFFL